jgi:flagellar motor switch protein FliM
MPDEDRLDILSQDEVNALLNAVESGEVQIEREEQNKKKICVNYDFHNPVLIPKEYVRILRVLHESFARNTGLALSGFLRTLVQVELVSVDQLTYNEFMLSLPNITYLNVVSIPPFKGNIVVEINVNMILLFIERLLGGESKRAISPRTLTDLEMAISSRVITRMLEEYHSAWRHIVEFNPRIETRGTDPRFAQIVHPEEMVLLICFEIRMGESSGILNICFPLSTFEPLGGNIARMRNMTSRRSRKDSGMTEMQQVLLGVPVVMKALLGRVLLQVQDVAGMQEGDMISLSRKDAAAVRMIVDRQSVFRARPSSRKQRKIVQVTEKQA